MKLTPDELWRRAIAEAKRLGLVGVVKWDTFRNWEMLVFIDKRPNCPEDKRFHWLGDVSRLHTTWAGALKSLREIKAAVEKTP